MWSRLFGLVVVCLCSSVADANKCPSIELDLRALDDDAQRGLEEAVTTTEGSWEVEGGDICQLKLRAGDGGGVTEASARFCQGGQQCVALVSPLQNTALCGICLDTRFRASPVGCTPRQREICQQLQNDTKRVNNGTCLPCGLGSYCPPGSVNPTAMGVFNLCAEGFVCPNATVQLPCPGGHICLRGTPRAIECRERGIYCTKGRSKPCPQGFYCPLGTPEPIVCPADHYCRALSFEPTPCVGLWHTCPTGSGTPNEVPLQVLALLGLLILGLAPQAAASLARRRIRGLDDKGREAERKEELVSRIVGHFTGRNAHHAELNGLSHHDPPISLSFDQLTLELPSGRKLLDGITGDIPAAGLCAVMGPSGCGKSTLMQALSGRVTEGVSGTIHVNGVATQIGNLPTGVGYVPQEDIVLETLTVRENIAYSAMLRLPRSTEAAVRDDIVDEVIHVLQLDLVQHEQVGGGSVRGLSGGQRKRVNIGLEMASDCGLLFLDEPTSGLDASSSLDILTALKTLTALGVTIIAVIHQPRYQIFNMFDHLLVLAAGKLAFCGPPRATIPYFEMLGYPSPSEINPADFLLDLVSKMQHGQPLWKTWIAFAADPESFLRGDHMSKASGKVANTLMDSFDGFRTRFSKFQEHSTPSLADDEVAKVLQILSDMTLEEQRLHETVKLSEYDEMRFPQFLALCLRLLGDYSMPEAEIIEIFNELDRGDDKVFDHEDMMVFVAKHSPNTLLDEAGDAGAGIELLLPSETPSVLVKTKRPLSPRNVSPRNGSPRNGSPRNVSPRKQRRGAFIESEGFELTPNVPEKMSPRRRSRSAFISKSFALDGDTSGELDTGDSQARKVAPSYIKQFVIFVRRCLLLRLKPGAYGADALEILLLCAVSATLAFAFGGRKTELVDVPTLAFLRSLALALLASLSSLKVLGTSQLFLRREEQSGLSGALFCWAAMTAGLINVILRPCLFTLVFQIFTQSEILVYQDALASLSIWWCFSGITHLIVALVPYSVALPIAALLPLFTCFFSGVSPSLSTLEPAVAMATWLSPSRWSSTVLGVQSVLRLPAHVLAIQEEAARLEWTEANASIMSVLLLLCGLGTRVAATATKFSAWRNAKNACPCLGTACTWLSVQKERIELDVASWRCFSSKAIAVEDDSSPSSSAPPSPSLRPVDSQLSALHIRKSLKDLHQRGSR